MLHETVAFLRLLNESRAGREVLAEIEAEAYEIASPPAYLMGDAAVRELVFIAQQLLDRLNMIGTYVGPPPGG